MHVFRVVVVKNIDELFNRCDENKDVSVHLGHLHDRRRCKVQVRGNPEVVKLLLLFDRMIR